MSMTAQQQVPKKIVIIGGGIQGASVAYHLSTHLSSNSITSIQILEAKHAASAASGKGGGFMARSWGDGSPTQSLHHLGYDLYKQLANDLNIESYRTLPVLSVGPGRDNQGVTMARKDKKVGKIMPNWLDGNIGRVGVLGYGDDTAQVTPKEVVEKMIVSSGVEVVLGQCVGIETEAVSDDDCRKVTGVKYVPRNGGNDNDQEEAILEADVVVVSAGPWSCAAEDWFDHVVDLPMEGVKSTSIVWKKGVDDVDATALFCGEDSRFGTHCKYESTLSEVMTKNTLFIHTFNNQL
jgi:glycine/D-amino acid oxidase-like deaminating enzyme